MMVTTNFSPDVREEFVHFKTEDGGTVTFTKDDIEFFKRQIDMIWGQMADDMFVNDDGVFDSSMTFTRTDVYCFGTERYSMVLEGNDTVRMDELRSRAAILGYGSNAYKEFIKAVTYHGLYGY